MPQIAYPREEIHKEKVIQHHIVEQLIQKQGYMRRSPADYDRSTALDKELLLKFVKGTQSESWNKLEDYNASTSETEFFRQVKRALEKRGTLDVLRQGIKLVPNIDFKLCFFKPASGLNAELLRLYDANVLSVIPELEYSQKNNNRLDIALFVNGIPLVTMECKNLPTGTNFRNAERQYCRERPPEGEPLLTFKRGALVHFALDEDNVSMTTRLANGNTRFLPFNRGKNQGAGNPDIEDEFRIAYLYCKQPEGQAIFSREVILDIVNSFLFLEIIDKKERLIFPRFQQLETVLKLIKHAKDHGVGHNYLIQHSAGSGKSKTIAWAAHRLISLHDFQDKSVFDTAIIVTDRIVLDRQLQKQVDQFAQTPGVVKKIDGTSRQLREAIEKGARIIITTIQKFSTEHLRTIYGQQGRRFAILVDEAHSSQSGKSSDSMAQALTREETEKSSEDIEDIIGEYQKQRGPQKNISYFAFTATPRNITLERFGTKGKDRIPQPFHLYSMRQAIEEGFILDVLQNYATYKAYYQLEKSIEDDPKVQGRRAQRKVARFASLHPTAIAQEVEIIVEHFRRHVMKQLEGLGKAMVVTQSREHAIRYYHAIKKYIEKNKYTGIKPLVAFSGEKNVNGIIYTEANINKFSETELPNRFDSSEYQLLIVAEKYQTGFDQPKLCAMYIDRKLDGLQAVQTLSRLNRIYSGKTDTFILDFRNTIEDIQNAFRPYYETTLLEEITDLNQIYELEGRIKTFSIIDQDEVEQFAEIFFKGDRIYSQARSEMQRLINSAVERFKYQEEEGKQEEFRQLLKSYIRFYSFVSQVMNLGDTWLEKLFVYSSWLVRFLPNREIPPDIEITDDMLELKAFRVEEKEYGRASLSPGSIAPLSPIEEFGANPYTEDEKRTLSEIVKDFNLRHGIEFTAKDFISYDQAKQKILTDEGMREMLMNNPPDVVERAFSESFYKEAIELLKRKNQLDNIFMTDSQSRKKITQFFLKRALNELKA